MRIRIVACLLSAALLGGCASEPPVAPPVQVWVVGVEALGWDRVEVLMARGEMPHLADLIARGARGTAVAPDPLDATSTWASLLSGKRPADHRIIGTLANLPTGRVAPTPSSQRPISTFWHLLGDDQQSVGVVGFPQSWPAERVDGWLVSDMVVPNRHNQTREVNFERVPGHMETWPNGLFEEVQPLVRPRADLERSLAARFFSLRESEYQLLYQDPIGSVRASENPLGVFAVEMQATRTHLDIARRIADSYRPRVMAVQLGLLDALQPYYWYFTYPEIFRAPEDGTRRFGKAVDEGHRWLDEQIGELVASLGPNDAILVVGNRGWGSEEVNDPDANFGRTLRPAPSAKALLVMAGRGVAPGVRLGQVSTLDVVPTLLRWTGRDAARDLPGNVLRDAFLPGYLDGIPAGVIDSHEENWFPAARFMEPDEDITTTEEALEAARSALENN